LIDCVNKNIKTKFV